MNNKIYKFDPKNLEFIVIIIPPIQTIKNKIMNIFPFPVVLSVVIPLLIPLFDVESFEKDIVL